MFLNAIRCTLCAVYLVDINFTGITLIKKPYRESDSRIAVFTKELGLVRALVQGTQKPLSRLAAHCEPLMLIRGRFIEKRQPRIVDAKTHHSFTHIKTHPLCYDASLNLLRHIEERAGELQQDERVWETLCASLQHIEKVSRDKIATSDEGDRLFHTLYTNLDRALGNG